MPPPSSLTACAVCPLASAGLATAKATADDVGRHFHVTKASEQSFMLINEFSAEAQLVACSI